MINIVLKGFWYPPLYSDWYSMLLFESSLSSAFWKVSSYSVIRAYSVSDFEKCITLFRYFSLLCYLELRRSWYLHVRNVVAVAAYSRLASRSQAKFHTKKLSPLVRPCAAAPAQSTTSAYRSLDFRRATSSQRGRWVGSWPLLLRSVHEDTS